MKILVVDDESSFGALLAHTLKRLGHQPVVATHPEDALELLAPDVDAVITDIDMPVMNGVELARAIRELHRKMPIAFCTGSAPAGRAVSEASEIGTVLPKVWTVADVRQVVEVLRGAPEPHKRSGVRIALRTWAQVLDLCRDSLRDRVQVTVPGPEDLDPGAAVNISLVLPEEITVKIAGTVRAVRPRRGERPEIVVELSGFTEELRARLQTLADANPPASATSRLGAYLHVSPRDSKRMKISETLRTNKELRGQIEDLAARMKLRDDNDDDNDNDNDNDD